jgi:hypothetical protein
MYITREFSPRSKTREREVGWEKTAKINSPKCLILWLPQNAILYGYPQAQKAKGDRKGDFSRFSLDAFRTHTKKETEASSTAAAEALSAVGAIISRRVIY